MQCARSGADGPADAAVLLASLREAAPGDRELRDRLEQALRESNDAGALARLLAERPFCAEEPYHSLPGR